MGDRSLRRASRVAPSWRALAIGASLLAGPALAQSEVVTTAPSAPALTPASAPAAAASPAPSESMVINLIRLLVKQGVITQDAADALRQQAEDEAAQARAAAGTAQVTPPSQTAPPQGVIRVPYVPQVVQNQIRDSIKEDVLAQAKAEGWAAPGTYPSWIDRFEFFGDFRFRDEFDFFSNNNIAPYIDYAAFNAAGPIDINANTNPNGLPFLNTRQDRLNQFSVRARLGTRVKVFNGVQVTLRLGTGNDNSPVSTTQLLGGGLAKKNVWLDQAYLTLTPAYWAQATFGRQPDPFVHTSLMYDDNLNFDGIALSAYQPVGPEGLKVFGTAGAFPLDYATNNFPQAAAIKEGDHTKWLFAAQAGLRYQPGDDLSWHIRGAVAFYGFENVQGLFSAPCDLWNGNKQCSTDLTRPANMQKGNTLFLIRNILPNPASPLNYAQPQFAGLSYNYNLLDLYLEYEAPLWGQIRGRLEGDYVHNFSYNPAAAFANPNAQPVTNFDIASGGVGSYRSGANAWLIKATFGDIDQTARGSWNIEAGYRWIQPDALLDAFNDHDFHAGGTNAKGYWITASYYFANNAWIDGRWFSANQVYGPPLAIDVLQLELNTKF